ncbi:MAG: hypothetical protein EHM20_09765, partial [Alphaproteobacteria bacterium]
MNFKRRKSDQNHMANILADFVGNKFNEKFYPFFKSIAFKVDAEVAHELTIKSMKYLGPWVDNVPTDPRFKLNAMGLTFKSPIGLAAGLDKNAEAIKFLTYLPFGFIE